MKKTALHIFSVWEERNVFDELFINELRSLIGECCEQTLTLFHQLELVCATYVTEAV